MEGLDIEISSTTLGNTEEGGTKGAVGGFAENLISKQLYTDTVLRNAQKFEDTTKEILPEAEFGVSALASSIEPTQLGELIKSVDYPYLVKWNLAFLNEKLNKSKSENSGNLATAVGFMGEIAYAVLQSTSDKKQIEDTLKTIETVKRSPVKIRTSIEVIGFEEELKKIKDINTKVQDIDRSLVWVLEPNKKIGDGTVDDFIKRFEQIREDNPKLNWAIDLDMGGLPKEKDRNLIQILESMQQNNLLPLYLSMSGREYKDGDILSHLPLGEDYEHNKAIGEWFRERVRQGKDLPGIIVETSPIQKDLLEDYKKFLESFKKGFGYSNLPFGHNEISSVES